MWYLDFVQDKSHISGRRWIGAYFNSLSNIYNFPDRQLPSDEINSSLILGIQANIWTETVGSEKRLDFMIFPRLAALAESAWTAQSLKNETSFDERLKADLPLYDKDGIYYYNPFYPAAHPEAIDFMPRIVKHKARGKRYKHHGGEKLHHPKSSRSGTKAAPQQHHTKKRTRHAG